MNKTFVLSDLHMFSHTSRYEVLLPQLTSLVKDLNTVIFNGDTFDFRRSVFNTSAETTEAAVAWLQPLLQENAHCQFHYILGNHDNVQSLITELERYSKEFPNFSLHREFFKNGDALFLHGDVCDGISSSTELQWKRAIYLTIEPDQSSIKLAKMITALKANMLTPLWHPKNVMCERILAYLRNAAPEELETTKRIFFGHTHCSFSGFRYKDITFTNTGSAIENLDWSPCYV